MTRYEVRETSLDEARQFAGIDALPPLLAHIGLYKDGELCGLCGTLLDPLYSGSPLEDAARVIVYFELRPGAAPISIAVGLVCRIRDWLRAQKRTVFAQQEDKFPQSGKFLLALGFRPTHEFRRDLQASSDRMLRMWVRAADA